MPETEITNLKIDMAELKTSISNIEKGLERNDADHKELKETIKDWIKTADERYAPAWVTDVLKIFIGTVILAVIGSLLSLVLK